MSHGLCRRARTRASAALVVLAVVFAAFAFLAAPAMAAAPTNDLIGNATLVGALPYGFTQSTQDATTSATDPIPSCVAGSQPTVWFRYNETSPRVLRVGILTNATASLVVYSGTPGSLTELACGAPEQLVTTTPGQTYYFMVPASSAPTAGVRLTVQDATPVPNDLVENATPISALPFSVTQSTLNATRSASDPPTSCISPGTTVWFRYDASSDQVLRVTTTPGYTLAAFDGSPGSTPMFCGGFGQQLVAVTAGHSYYFVTAGNTVTPLTFALQVSTPPANDLIENATPITALPFSVSGSTQDATKSATDPVPSCAVNVNTNTVWFRYEAPTSQLLRVAKTAAIGGYVIVYEDSPGGLTELACSNSGEYLAQVTGGKTYYLMFVPAFPVTTFTLSLHVATPPANDLIENATPIVALPFSATQTTQDATHSGSDPAAPCVGSLATVWFRHEAGSSAPLRVTPTLVGGSFSVAIFEGSPGALNLVTCISTATVIPVEAGHTYYFAVATAFPIPVTLGVQLATPPANDLIENATPITVLPFSATQSTEDATRSETDPQPSCIGGPTLSSVWYRYDAPATQLLRLTATGNAFSLGMVVYDGTPAWFTQVACTSQPSQQLVVTAGHTYYVTVATFFAANITLGVTLLDTAPTLTVPDDITIPATGPDGAVVEYDAIATDGSAPAPPVVCTPSSGSTFPVGDTVVDCTANDASGLSDHSTFTVHVTDTTAPELALPGTVTVDASGPTGATVDYAVGATDNADPNPVVICAPESGGVFAIGNTEVQCTATDASANTTQGVFTVHVNSALEQIANLRAVVAAWTTSGLRSTLLTNLQDATTGLTKGNTAKACGALTEFIGQVTAQSGKKLSVPLAQQLTADATRISAVIRCRM